MWSVSDFIIFLFIYKINGTPLGERPQSEEAEPTHFIPAQWGKDSKLALTWPKGEVPYFFDTKSYDASIKSRVVQAIGALEADSCIRFKEQKTKPGKDSGSWLHFTNPGAKRDCFHEPSYRANGEIQVVLGYDCLKQRDITHAVMHGIGFRDEVAHPQRDLYVKVMWANIQPVYRALFRIQPMQHAHGLLEYDTMSIMHFHDRAFSLNGQATVTAMLPGLKINPSNELSHLDKMKLRIMFGHECNKRKVGEVLDTCQGILSEDSTSAWDLKSNDTQNNEKDDSNKHEEDKTNKEDKKPEDVDPKEEIINVSDKTDEIDEKADKDNDDYQKPNNNDDSNKQDVDDSNKDNRNPENVDPKEEFIIVGDKTDDIDEKADKDNDDYQKPNNNDDSNKQDVDNDDKKPENVDSKEEFIITGDKLNENLAIDYDDYQNQNDHDDSKKQDVDDKKPNEEFIIVGDKITDDVGEKAGKDIKNEDGSDNNKSGDESPNAEIGNEKNEKSEEFIIAGDNVKGGDDNAKSNEDDQEDVDEDNDGPDKETEDKASNTRKWDKKQKAKQEILSNKAADEDDDSLKGNVVHNENLKDTD